MTLNSSLTENLNGFAFKLFEKISASKDENLFISPFSIMVAMTMCFTGSRNETNEQLKDLLSLNGLKDEDIYELSKQLLHNVKSELSKSVVIEVVNKIYPSLGFEIKNDFISILKNNFQSEVEQIDFTNPIQSSKTINEWVAAKTNQKITNLISPESIDNLVRLILVNAIYFKGNWLEKFDTLHTSQELFTLADGSKTKVDMMKLNGKSFNVLYDLPDLNASICKLPYAGGTISFTIILPNSQFNLTDIEKQLDSKKFHKILSSNFYKEKLNIHLPKFKMEYKIELSNHFKQMGAPLAFDMSKSDFSGINADPKVELYISQVLHKAIVEVSEEGTEAAAATAIVMKTRMMASKKPREFFCDRPFLFIINDNIKNNILFIGKYVKPN